MLLENAGFNFETMVFPIDENYPASLKTEEIAEYISQMKSKAFEGHLIENNLVLTADSIVAKNNQIYEKPHDREDAVHILQNLSDSCHTVYTGVTFRTQHAVQSISVSTRVTIDKLSLEEINYYIDNYQPFDKAGAYGIQDWLGLCKVTKIEGSYTNVMGLPMQAVYGKLLEINRKFFSQ